MRFLLLATLLLFPLRAVAQEPFDLAVRGYSTTCGIQGVGEEPTLEFVPVPAEEDIPNNINAIAGAKGGRVIGVTVDGAIIEARPDLTTEVIFPRQRRSEGATALLTDRAGNVYVLVNRDRLQVISAAGEDVAEYPVDAASMDLATDQCTMFLSGAGVVRRFNVCTGTPEADFTSGVGYTQLKILPDGGLLVGGSTLRRYDRGGALVRTYPVSSTTYALALGRDGSTALVSYYCGLGVDEIDLATGELLRRVPLQFSDVVTSIVAYRGWTAALGPLVSEDIPSLSTMMLVALTVLIAAVAFRRIG
ncbi:MAG TPA: hypothetical protein VF846_00525 [Thermoanaerobaculia bacterium]|jgi:hypothetical protein